jgi:maleate cis-trans isomerase
VTASPGARYGWRARIGFITPTPGAENNPFEFYLMAPEGVTIVLTSLGVMALNQSEYDAAVGRLKSAVDEMVKRRVDAIVQAGVPPIVTHGWGYEQSVLGQIRSWTDIPAATDIGACLEAMRALHMQRVVMVTPFDEAMHQHVREYVGHAGLEIVGATSLREPDVDNAYDISIVPLAHVYRAARQAFRAADAAHGVWITGALMPSVGVIQQLEDDLGVPVISSMQAMAWKGMRLAGVTTSQVRGFGRLFQVSG